MELLLIAVQVIISVAVIFVILMQSGKSAGLSGSISGGAETFFGKKKGIDEFLSKITVWLGAAFFIITFILAILRK